MFLKSVKNESCVRIISGGNKNYTKMHALHIKPVTVNCLNMNEHYGPVLLRWIFLSAIKQTTVFVIFVEFTLQTVSAGGVSATVE